MEVTNRANLAGAEFERFREALQDHRSLQDLLLWAQQQPEGALIPGVIADLVIQDEFTHDVVVPWQSRFVVYGTT